MEAIRIKLTCAECGVVRYYVYITSGRRDKPPEIADRCCSKRCLDLRVIAFELCGWRIRRYTASAWSRRIMGTQMERNGAYTTLRTWPFGLDE